MEFSHGITWRLCILAWVFLNGATAQSLITGGIAGTITDPTLAVIPGAAVTSLSVETGETQLTQTNEDGVYSFAQLKPGHYQVTVTMRGFAAIITTNTVAVGQTTQVDLTLRISQKAETVEVVSGTPLISTDPGVVTNYTPTEVALLPAPGQDMTTIAFTAPGVIVSPGTGVGNFTANGLPATSNLFTINGENAMDPFSNVNFSGASNLMLGLNEVQEAAVVTNAYSGQYGQLSGAHVTFVTKSGTNAFHGNAAWWWNGRALNSNDFFANASGEPKPFENSNQWAASIGGPIIKDHTFFFVDTEGLRFILPQPFVQAIPTPAFAAAILNNIQAVQPNELPAYQAMFRIYTTASAGKTLTSVPVSPGDECSSVVLPNWISGSTCANTFFADPTASANEWFLAGRVDQKLSAKDDLFFRFKLDRGLQPTYVDPLSSAFNATSNQPAWDCQINWRHAFNGNLINSFTATVNYYSFLFRQNEAAWKAVFPDGGVYLDFADGFSPINSEIFQYPTGRNTTQYQLIDDLSWTRGTQAVKFGANFLRYDVSDHDFFNINPQTYFSDLTSPTLGPTGMLGMQAFADGIAQQYVQQYSPSTDVPIAVWGLGLYAEDQWKLRSNFTLMGALRLEKNSNPVCKTNCFSNFKTSFSNLPSVMSPAPGDVPYSSDLNTGLHHAYPGGDTINVSPRVSFSWAPTPRNSFPFFSASRKTIISGGVGIFHDNPPTGIISALLGNPPTSVLFAITPVDAHFQTIGILPFDPSAPHGGPASFKAAAAAFNLKYSYNELSALLNPIIGYTPPLSIVAIEGTVHSPQVQEWNLKVDQQITESVALSVVYNGNHSIHVLYYDGWWNAVAANSIFANVVPIAPRAPNYAFVKTLQSGADSNYNGLTATVRVLYQKWLTAHFNYTYSHALDETSNGGVFSYGNGGLQQQINPGSLRANNYGNADYDIRDAFSADYVIAPSMHFENGLAETVLGGWQWSGKVYARSGFPYTVTDGYASPSLVQGGVAVAQVISGGASNSCGAGAAYSNAKITPCLNAAAFANTSVPGFAYTAYPTQTRNQFRGPDYINFDMGLYKTFRLKERYAFGLGATAFNVFNHPNFGLPDNNLGDPFFGQSLYVQGVPVSPYGVGLGFDSSVRIVQLSAKLTF